jgi:farnesyl-diphosphate farnesyltransferase
MLESALSPPEMLSLLRGVSRSFYLSIRVLPAGLRRPVAVAYLLARASDTLADTCRIDARQRRERLDALAAAMQGRAASTDTTAGLAEFARAQTDPAEHDLIVSVPRCLRWLEDLEPADRDDVRAVLRHITRGQALDIERFAKDRPTQALQTPEQLLEYAYLVAGCVGEFWTDLSFRHLPRFAALPHEQMRELGREYGMALQLVNILRDAGADLAAGRCYFPADELAAAGARPEHLLSDPARLDTVWNRWHAQAEQRLELGMRYADAVCNWRVRAASAMPALLAARTLALLQSAGPQRWQHKVKVPRREVRWMMARLAVTLAGRAPLHVLFGRTHGPA